MEEINSMHEVTIEWGCVTNLLDRIALIEEKIDGGWGEMIDMIGDAIAEESVNKDPASVFFNLYGFLWRLYFRVKQNPVRQPFNRYSFDERNDCFTILNYDYKVYCWAIQNGLGKGISGSYITIPAEKLTDKQVAALKQRC